MSVKHEPRVDDSGSLIKRFETLGQFFDGGDIVLEKNCTIKPTAHYGITETHGMLNWKRMADLGIQETEAIDVLELLSTSARSRGAQVGLMVMLPHQFTTDPDEEVEFRRRLQDETYVRNGVLRFPLVCVNLGPRTLLGEAGDGVANVYTEIGANLLSGKTLRNTIGNGISIDGTYGKDWSFIDDEGNLQHANSAQIGGLALRVSNARYGVTAGPPIHVFDKHITDYRGYLSKHRILMPIQPGDNPDFWVGETTAPITIDPGINALLYDLMAGGGSLFQTLSFHIKGGQTNGWQIRVEACADSGMMDIGPLSFGEDADNQEPVDYERDLWVRMNIYQDK